MSRGAGRLQRMILDRLRQRNCETTCETLRWELWDETGEVASSLPNSWNTSIDRAAKGLCLAGSHVRMEYRRLNSLDEFLVHYPNKTLSADTRCLRKLLLPVVVEWLGTKPRYSTAQNEKFYLKQIEAADFDDICRSWQRSESSLMQLFPRLQAAHQTQLLFLVTKGKSLFETREVNAKRGFTEYAQICLQSGFLSENLAGEVKTLAHSVLPSVETGPLRLKSFIHLGVDVPKRGRCSLKTKLLEHLDKTCPDVVHALSGYEPPPESRSRFMVRQPMGGAKQSDDLHHLIDHTVFAKYRFLILETEPSVSTSH